MKMNEDILEAITLIKGIKNDRRKNNYRSAMLVKEEKE